MHSHIKVGDMISYIGFKPAFTENRRAWPAMLAIHAECGPGFVARTAWKWGARWQFPWKCDPHSFESNKEFSYPRWETAKPHKTHPIDYNQALAHLSWSYQIGNRAPVLVKLLISELVGMGVSADVGCVALCVAKSFTRMSGVNDLKSPCLTVVPGRAAW